MFDLDPLFGPAESQQERHYEKGADLMFPDCATVPPVPLSQSADPPDCLLNRFSLPSSNTVIQKLTNQSFVVKTGRFCRKRLGPDVATTELVPQFFEQLARCDGIDAPKRSARQSVDYELVGRVPPDHRHHVLEIPALDVLKTLVPSVWAGYAAQSDDFPASALRPLEHDQVVGLHFLTKGPQKRQPLILGAVFGKRSRIARTDTRDAEAKEKFRVVPLSVAGCDLPNAQLDASLPPL